MGNDWILAKTVAGVEEIATRTRRVPPRLRTMLILVDGRRSVEQLDLDVLIGPAWVAAFDSPREVTAADLEDAGIPAGTARLLLKTRNSRLWAEKGATFDDDFVGIAADGARWMVDHGIRLVGIDYLGVERFDSVPLGAPVYA